MAGMAWQVEAAGCPCRIEAAEGEWVVVVASSIASGENLADAIRRASGGLVEPAEASRLADSIHLNVRTHAAAAAEALSRVVQRRTLRVVEDCEEVDWGRAAK